MEARLYITEVQLIRQAPAESMGAREQRINEQNYLVDESPFLIRVGDPNDTDAVLGEVHRFILRQTGFQTEYVDYEIKLRRKAHVQVTVQFRVSLASMTDETHVEQVENILATTKDALRSGGFHISEKGDEIRHTVYESGWF